MTDVVGKLWGFCHTLRHDGISYGDYIEQITYLLFLKMADERGVEVPRKCDWKSLRDKTGTDLVDHYVDTLRTLGKQPGILGDIYSGAQSRFNKPVNLKQLVNLIDETEWTTLGVDIKAAAYEGLLEKAASEGKKGAGQYFTPRVLIQSIVRCMKPDPRAHREFKVCDPGCGTGGFLVAAYEWLFAQTKGALPREAVKRIRDATYFGQDIDALPRRLALMNLHLHQLDPKIVLGDSIYEPPSGERFDVILTNPPFGTRGANQAPEREDFTIETSNKQLNFVQHVLTILKPGGGRAARQLPLRRPGRRGPEDPDGGLRASHRPAAAARDLHALQPGRQGERDFLHQGGADGAGVDLRRAKQRSRGHEEGPAPDGGAFHGIRILLRGRSERPVEARPEGFHRRPLALFPVERSQGARLQARRVQVDQGRFA